MDKPEIKPPLGLMPREIHNDKRKQEIVDAITRYAGVDMEVPAAWWNELLDLTASDRAQQSRIFEWMNNIKAEKL